MTNQSHSHINTEVLIIGAGPVGLALAIELGHRGVRCLVVERHERVGQAPRAKTTHVRTREHLRRWGIARTLADASPLGIDYPSDVAFVTRLSGYPLARFQNAFHCAPGKNPLYSEHAQWVPQYRLEEVLRAHAATLPSVSIIFQTEFVSATQSADQVSSMLRELDGGKNLSVRSSFLVGADGARSGVRTLIGATMQGSYGLSRNHNFVFKAPRLADAHPHGKAIMYWQVNSELPSLLGPMDVADTWFFMPTRLAEGVKIGEEAAAAAIARSTGINLDYQILRSDEWVASQLIADRYRDGRIFLAGDACHLHPPFGGYGMNMGIADGVDLGWKLSAVLNGWGGSRLLDSYAEERRPTHELVIGEAVANHAFLADSFWQQGLEAPDEQGANLRRVVGEQISRDKAREFHSLGCVLGYRYAASSVIVADGSEPPSLDLRGYQPSSYPGCVAPHAWLGDGSSLYDHFGAGFTLLVKEGAEEAEQVAQSALRLGLPLTVFALPPEARTNFDARFTLVRPDQHVAWRGSGAPSQMILQTITGRGADPMRSATAP